MKGHMPIADNILVVCLILSSTRKANGSHTYMQDHEQFREKIV